MKNKTQIFVIGLSLSGILLAGCGNETVGSGSAIAAEPSIQEITVYKTPTCGCCKKWVSYMENEGFKVTAIDKDDVNPIKTELGLTNNELKSCHTAVIGDYVVEGHVPVEDIHRLLKEKPEIVGLSAPGMPSMSPGMNGVEAKDFAVLAFKKNGSSRVFSQY